MVTRRQILLGTGSVALVALGGTVGYQFRATKAPDTPPNQPNDQARVLVTYATMMGSTGGVAETYAKTLQAAGHQVHFEKVRAGLDPSRFDAVVMGSAIKTSAWLPEIVDWAGTHNAVLRDKPVALFECSMTCAGAIAAGGPSEADLAQMAGDLTTLQAAAPSLTGRQVDFLPGRLDFDFLSPMIRMGYPFVGGTFWGDHRDPARAEAAAGRFAARPEVAALV